MKNIDALTSELEGVAVNCFGDLTMDEWLQALQQHLKNFAKCQVSIEHLQKVFGCLVPFRLPASGASAFLVLGTPFIQDLVGRALASHVGACAMAEIRGLPTHPDPPDLGMQLRADVVQLLERRSLGSEGHSKLLNDLEATPTTPQEVKEV